MHVWVLLVHRAETVLVESLVEDSLREGLLVRGILLLGRGIVVELGLFVDELLEFFDFETVELEVEVEISDGGTGRFVVFLVELGHVRVF